MAYPTSKATMDDEGGPSSLLPRRKGAGTRAWLVVSESGESRLEEVGKYSIMKWTGLPARDLRILDPMLSYASTILGRERAIVINLEHIKAIITAKEVFLLNCTNPLVVQFVQDLQRRISSPPQQSMERDGTDSDDRAEPSWAARSSFQGLRNWMSPNSAERKDNNSDTIEEDVAVATDPKVLPFEFKALEACLVSACTCLESETQTLEEEAYPALDELTSKISTLNLERVRQIKVRLVALSGRVQKVRDELEQLLDDDNDMAEMYLTEKLTANSLDNAPLGDEVRNPALEVNDERAEDSKSEKNSEITSFKPNIEEMEILLEAYFAQLDGVLQKLSDMSEYVDDTEDYINIMLDDTQNQLLQMGVMLSTANMILNAGIVVVGIFGMNIHIDLFEAPTIKFWETMAGTVGGIIGLYAIAVGWGLKKKLIAV